MNQKLKEGDVVMILPNNEPFIKTRNGKIGVVAISLESIELIIVETKDSEYAYRPEQLLKIGTL